MATSNRIYKSTDWQLWIYEPVAGKFRLDFSLIDGPDVLEASNEGGMEIADIKIISIDISEGSSVSNGTITSFNPAQANISFSLENFTKTQLTEYYSGKQIVITVKNQVTNPALSNAVYGFNTPYFYGKVNTVSLSVDSITNLAVVNLAAEENLGELLNLPLSITKNTTDFATDLVLTKIDEISQKHPDEEYGIFVSGSGQTHFGTTGLVTKNIGEWIQDMLDQEAACLYPVWVASGSNYFRRAYFLGFPNKLSGSPFAKTRTLDLNSIYEMNFDLDGNGKPTSMIIRTESGSVFNFGSGDYSTLSENVSLDVSVDILNYAEAEELNRLRQSYKTELNVINIAVLNAYNNQEITFDNLDLISGSSTGLLTRPETNLECGYKLILDLSEYGYSSTESFFVLSKEHNITPDSWVTTYNLVKGSN
jgi:hypothetical protein